MNTASVALALFVASAALPAAAATTATSKTHSAPGRTAVVQEEPTGSQPQPRQICRSEQITGSYIRGERFCMTKGQWRTVDQGGSVTIYRKRVR